MGYMTNGLTFNALREANLARLPLFQNAQGEPAHAEADGSDWTNAQWLQAVLGELGELANVLKKVDRGDFALEEAGEQIAHELADVVTYLDILAMRLDVDLGRAVVDKFNLVSARVHAGVRLDGPDWFYDAKLGRVPAEVVQAMRGSSVRLSEVSDASANWPPPVPVGPDD